ncbi:MAG TPA: DUF4199 domain-containing protein [Chitinophagaceae bacterium]
MKSTAIRYGLLASAFIIVVNIFNVFVLAKTADYNTQEIAGYLTIALSMIFVFFGIRHYRDKVNNGYLSFGQGLKIGLLIALMPALLFGLFNVLYVEVINPGWQDEYYGHYVESIKASASAAELPAKLEALEKQKQFFSSPLMTFLVMAATVFIIGAIVAIISSLALRRGRNRVEA